MGPLQETFRLTEEQMDGLFAGNVVKISGRLVISVFGGMARKEYVGESVEVVESA